MMIGFLCTKVKPYFLFMNILQFSLRYNYPLMKIVNRTKFHFIYLLYKHKRIEHNQKALTKTIFIQVRRYVENQLTFYVIFVNWFFQQFLCQRDFPPFQIMLEEIISVLHHAEYTMFFFYFRQFCLTVMRRRFKQKYKSKVYKQCPVDAYFLKSREKAIWNIFSSQQGGGTIICCQAFNLYVQLH